MKNAFCFFLIKFVIDKSNFAFWLTQISYSWSLKILAIKRWFPFNFAKKLQGHHYVVENCKLSAHISFDSGLQNSALPTLMLISSACFWVDLNDIQWNEVVTSTARSFNYRKPAYLNFLNVINLCPNIWFSENSKCQQFLFWKKNRQKNKFFMFLRGRYFEIGGPIDMNLTCFERLLWAF